MIAEDSLDSYAPGPWVGQQGGSGWVGAWLPGTVNTANVADTSGDSLIYTAPDGWTIDGKTRAGETFGTLIRPATSRAVATQLPDVFYVA